MRKRKNYSVSVPVDSALYNFLEALPNNSKFFIEAAEYYRNDRDIVNEIRREIGEIREGISQLSDAVKGGVIVSDRRSIGSNRPVLSRGRRE